MRISDWSSDVCSSDIHSGPLMNRLRAVGNFVTLEEHHIGVVENTMSEGSVVEFLCKAEGRNIGRSDHANRSVIAPPLAIPRMCRRRSFECISAAMTSTDKGP